MSREIKHRSYTRSQVHDVRARIYIGEESAQCLIEWLNSRKGNKTDRIEKLLRLLLEAERSDTLEASYKLNGQIADIRHSLNLRFEPRLAFLPDTSSWTFAWIPLGNKAISRPEAFALLALLDLTSKGLASRIRKCQMPGCNQWFWARFEHQKFHATSCQDEAYHSTPAWKAKRAARMRELRKEQRLREQREQQLHKRRE